MPCDPCQGRRAEHSGANGAAFSTSPHDPFASTVLRPLGTASTPVTQQRTPRLVVFFHSVLTPNPPTLQLWQIIASITLPAGPVSPSHHPSASINFHPREQPSGSDFEAMALRNSNSRSSSNSSVRSNASSTANVRASCYAVNTSTASLQGFHYSTTGVAGAEWCS